MTNEIQEALDNCFVLVPTFTNPLMEETGNILSHSLCWILRPLTDHPVTGIANFSPFATLSNHFSMSLVGSYFTFDIFGFYLSWLISATLRIIAWNQSLVIIITILEACGVSRLLLTIYISSILVKNYQLNSRW